MSLGEWIVTIAGFFFYVLIALWVLRDLFTGKAVVPIDPSKRQTSIYVQLASALFMLSMGALLVFAVLDENLHVFSTETASKLFDVLLVLILATCSLFFGKIFNLIFTNRVEPVRSSHFKTLSRFLATLLFNFGGSYWIYGSPIFSITFSTLLALAAFAIEKKYAIKDVATSKENN